MQNCDLATVFKQAHDSTVCCPGTADRVKWSHFLQNTFRRLVKGTGWSKMATGHISVNIEDILTKFGVLVSCANSTLYVKLSVSSPNTKIKSPPGRSSNLPDVSRQSPIAQIILQTLSRPPRDVRTRRCYHCLWILVRIFCVPWPMTLPTITRAAGTASSLICFLCRSWHSPDFWWNVDPP